MVISYTLQLPNTRFLFVPPPPKQAVSPYPLSSRRQPQPLPHAGLRCRSPAPADLQKHGADEGIDRGSSGGGGPADALEAPEDEPALAEDGEEVQHGGAGPGCAHTSHCSAHFRRKSSFSYEASYWLLGQKRMWGKKANGEAKRGGAGREGGARGKGRRAKGGGGRAACCARCEGGARCGRPGGAPGVGAGGRSWAAPSAPRPRSAPTSSAVRVRALGLGARGGAWARVRGAGPWEEWGALVSWRCVEGKGDGEEVMITRWGSQGV